MDELIACFFIVGVLWGAVSLLSAGARWLDEQHHKRKILRADRAIKRQQRRNRELDKRRRRELQLFSQRQTAEANFAKRKRIKTLSIKLQQALEQVAQSRDFRRAASIAAICREVPVEFRRSQFKRFRKLLEEHAVACLKNRVDRRHLTISLADLLQHLGVARFEADYIIESAVRSLQEQIAPRKTPDFQSQLQDELREHQRRVAAIKTLPDDPETLEQMLEIEHRRHADVLVQLTAARGKGADGVVTL